MDKVPDLGLPILYRVVLPGAVATLWAFPFLSPLLSTLGVAGLDKTGVLVGIALLGGFVLSLLDDPIYQTLEGRIGWPGWFAVWRRSRWKKRVDSQLARQADLRKQGRKQDPEYTECWSFLRQFPVDANGEPTVTQPSRIGNVIAAYEQYPDVRYGMDSVFYWPRIWLLVEKDTREEIDTPWAAVDAILYVAFATAVLAIVYLALALVSAVGSHFGFFGSFNFAAECFVAALVLMLVYLVCLRLSIAGLVATGEKFKSVFDLYRSKLTLAAADEEERATWKKLFGQLQYGVSENEPRTDA